MGYILVSPGRRSQRSVHVYQKIMTSLLEDGYICSHLKYGMWISQYVPNLYVFWSRT